MIDGLRLDPVDERTLLAIATDAVVCGVRHRRRVLPGLDHLSPVLQAPGASFVTLRRRGALLGCIGTLEAVRPLAEDVAVNAYAAAFADPRLPAVTADDLAELAVKVSVLSDLEALDAASRAELVSVLRPHVDGLLVVSGRRRGTFLPSVWEQVRDTDHFLDLLWHKAGLRVGSWPADLRVWRYQTVEFGD